MDKYIVLSQFYKDYAWDSEGFENYNEAVECYEDLISSGYKTVIVRETILYYEK